MNTLQLVIKVLRENFCNKHAWRPSGRIKGVRVCHVFMTSAGVLKQGAGTCPLTFLYEIVFHFLHFSPEEGVIKERFPFAHTKSVENDAVNETKPK